MFYRESRPAVQPSSALKIPKAKGLFGDSDSESPVSPPSLTAAVPKATQAKKIGLFGDSDSESPVSPPPTTATAPKAVQPEATQPKAMKAKSKGLFSDSDSEDDLFGGDKKQAVKPASSSNKS